MRILLLIGITFVIFSLVPLFYDNRDHTVRQENELVITSNTRLLLQNSHQQIKEEVEKRRLKEKQKLSKLMDATKNVCFNGKDPKKFTNEDKVNEFINGPCAPVVLVPGLAGTSLQIVIDCEKLQLESPEIFAACGWGTCSAWQFWSSRPDAEYRLWISTTTSKVGIIQTSPSDHCFGSLIELQYDDEKKEHKKTPGVELTYHGNTPSTSSNAECGLTGISNMTDDYLIMYMMCDYKGFAGIGDLLKNMGYVSGLTFQPMPYDYRKGIRISETQQLMKQTLDNFYDITGKKSIIMTHSLGSLHTLNLLLNLDQAYKDQHIATVFTMGAPYVGSSKALRAQLGGDPSYLDSFLGLTVGINYWNQNKAINSASSQIDIYPRDAFFRFKDEPWMKDLLNRYKQEQEFLKTGVDKVDSVSWFPSPTYLCTNITARKPNCLMNLQNLQEYFIEIQGQKLGVNDIPLILKDYTINGTKINDFYTKDTLDTLQNFNNPGVPYLVLYGSYGLTEYQFKYSKNPLEQVTKTGDFYFPEETIATLGDSTVIASSAVTPAVKWIYEHKNGLSNNPVKLVEFCSFYNSGSSVYDKNENGQRSFTQSGYFGLKCDCLAKPSDTTNCKHSCMINDKVIIEFVSDLVQNGQKSAFTKTPKSKSEIDDYVNNCRNLKNN